MNRTLVCILCPNGCEIDIEYNAASITAVRGNKCSKGEGYAKEEIFSPRRSIASSVGVTGGDLPLCSVRLSAPVPKERIFDVMEIIKKFKCKAPVKTGDVLIPNVLGLDSDVIATRNIDLC